MQTTMYLYRITNKKVLQKIQFIACRLGIKVKAVTEQMAGLKVGYITGLDGFDETASGQPFTMPEEPVMLLKDFDNAKLDKLLSLLRTSGIPKISLKATLTESNKNWYFYELYEELKRERNEFSK